MDYDPQHSTTGCGSRHSPLLNTTHAEDEFNKYVRLASSSLPIEYANSGHFDIGLLVALPVEYQAIATEITNLAPIRDHHGVAMFYRGTFTTDSGRKLQVLVAHLHATGNISSAIAATLMVEYYKAALVVNVGIAGGIRGEVVLGDVVVGQYVLYYESKKVTKDGESPEFKTLPYRPSTARNIHDARRYLQRVKCPRPCEADVKRSPCATFDSTIASGEKVIGDPSLLATLKNTVSRKMAAVDNESAGVYMAVLSMPGDTAVLAVRGISDYADEKKDDNWHSYAAGAAAAYVFDLMASDKLCVPDECGWQLHNANDAQPCGQPGSCA